MKITGAIIILIISAVVGYLLSESLKTRLNNLSEVISFIDYIGTNIKMFRTPLNDIYKNYHSEYFIKKGVDFSQGNTLYTEAINAGILSGKEEKEILKNFCDKIGNGTVDEMEKLCLYTNHEFSNIKEKLQKDFPEKQKVYKAISFLAGISVVIIII